MNTKRNKALNLRNHIYFNAGMLIINITKWNKFNTFTKVLQAIQNEPQKFRYLDQDALNLILTNHIQYLDTKFNCIDINNIDKKISFYYISQLILNHGILLFLLAKFAMNLIKIYTNIMKTKHHGKIFP